MSNTNTPEKPVVVFISNDHDTGTFGELNMPVSGI